MSSGEIPHRPESDRADPATLHIARHGNQERAKDVGVALVEAAHDRAVDARREIIERAIPAQRDRVDTSEDLFPWAEEVELEVGPLLGKTAPMDGEDIAVVVVLAEQVAGALPTGDDQVGTLGDRRTLHIDRAPTHQTGGRSVRRQQARRTLFIAMPPFGSVRHWIKLRA
jgi:hypothetical protein